MRHLASLFALAICSLVLAQTDNPPPSKSNTAAFLDRPGLVFAMDAKDLGSFKVNETWMGTEAVTIKLTAIVTWDYVKSEEKIKAMRFRTNGFYGKFDLDLFIDYDELDGLQQFFQVFDDESKKFIPEKDTWRRVAFSSRGGLGMALEAYNDKRDLRVEVFNRSVYMLAKDREKMKTIIAQGRTWLDAYNRKN